MTPIQNNISGISNIRYNIRYTAIIVITMNIDKSGIIASYPRINLP